MSALTRVFATLIQAVSILLVILNAPVLQVMGEMEKDPMAAFVCETRSFRTSYIQNNF